MSDATTVEAAAATLARLECERNEVLDQQAQLADRRRDAAYAAHGDGDREASKLLDGLHEKAAKLASRLASIDDALGEAKRRLESAQRYEAKAADRARATEQRKVVARFVVAGGQLDEAAALLAKAAHDLTNAHGELTALGIAHPRAEQIDVIGYQALQTVLSATPWCRRFETIAPGSRKSFGDLTRAWATTVERQIASRLGGERTDEAA